jgi:hypothetical protein
MKDTLHSPPVPRRRRWLLRLMLLPVAAAAGLWAFVLWDEYRTAARLADAIAEADRLDPGWRIDDLLARRAVLPDQQNAAHRIFAVAAKLPKTFPDADPDQTISGLSPPARLTEPQRAALAKLLAPVADLLPEARTLTDLPAGRFPLTAGRMFFGDAHTQEPRSVQTLLRYDLLDRLEAGDTAGALTAWRAAYHTGRAIGDEPLIISQTVCASCRSGAVELLERLLAQAEPDEADLARVQKLLEDDDTAPLFLVAARGERAVGFGTVELLKANQANVSTWTAWGNAARGVWNRDVTVAEATAVLPGRLPGQQATLLRHMNRLVEAAKRPVEEWGPLLDAWLAEVPHLPALARMLAQASGPVGEVFRRSHAELRCAAAAVAAERFRRQHGRWPAGWDEVVRAGLLRAAPVDPYDGRPLRLKPTADGLIVYSVGSDGADGGGPRGRQKPVKPGSDLGFQLWDPTARRQPAPPKP